MSFKILSLEGGGVRGAFGAACLAEFERLLKRPLAEYFDLIAGTSTGAIIGAVDVPAILSKSYWLSVVWTSRRWSCSEPGWSS